MALSSNKENADFPSLIAQSDATTAADANLLTGDSGRVYSISVVNADTTFAFLKFYDDKQPTIGTTGPIFQFRATSATTHHITSKTGIKISTALAVNLSNTAGTAAGSNPGATCTYTIFGS